MTIEPRNVLQLADIHLPEIDSLDMRGLANLLYRENVRQKHSDKHRVKQDLKKNPVVSGHGRQIDPGAITADEMTQLIGAHVIEAQSLMNCNVVCFGNIACCVQPKVCTNIPYF